MRTIKMRMRTLKVIKDWAGHLPEIRQFKKAAREFSSHGLTLGYVDHNGNAIKFRSRRAIGFTGIQLHRADLLADMRPTNSYINEVGQYLIGKRADGQSLTGWLNLPEAARQFTRANAALEKRSINLEAVHLRESINGNLEVPSQIALAKKHEDILEFFHELSRCETIPEAAKKIVWAAKNLWPGGNPSYMEHVVVNGQEYLVPIAVALPDEIIEAGQIILRKRLGKYHIPLSDMYNPYVRAFVEGVLSNRTIDYSEHVRVCAGFIGRETLTFLQNAYMPWPSWPKRSSRNGLIMAPLVVKDPESQMQIKIGILAVLKEGPFSAQEARLVQYFVNGVAESLNSISIRKRYGDAIAKERRSREAVERMQPQLQRAAAQEARREMADHATHRVKGMVFQADALCMDGIRLESKEHAAAISIINKKIELGLPLTTRDTKFLDGFRRQGLELFETCHRVIHDGDEMVKGMLALASEGGAGIILSEHLKKIIAPLKAIARKKGIDLQAYFAGLKSSDAVMMMVHEINTLLSNLVINAMEAFESFEVEKKHITIEIGSDDQSVMIRVKDNAGGIPKEVVARVLENKEIGITTKKEGSGWGLPAVMSLVAKNGGLIEVFTLPGQGTEFVITLPKAARPAAKILSPIPVALPRLRTHHLSIAYLDDRPNNHRPMAVALQSIGVPKGNLQCFAKPEDLIEQLRQDYHPDVIISDLHLGPEQNGLQVLREIQQLYQQQGGSPLPKMIVFTGLEKPDEDQAQELEALGASWVCKSSKAAEDIYWAIHQLEGPAKIGEEALPEVDNLYAKFGARLGYDAKNLLTPLHTAIDLMREDIGAGFFKKAGKIFALILID